MSDIKCPFCGHELQEDIGYDGDYSCPNCRGSYFGSLELWQGFIRTRKVLDKGMEHITGLNNMIESWYKLLQSDKDASTKYAILKSAISAYVENKGGDK